MVNEQPRPLTSVPDEAMEAVERRNHWFRLAVELGQQDDFRELLAAERQSAAEQIALAIEDKDNWRFVEGEGRARYDSARIAREVAK